jgi:ArsR family transcriptional regulator
VQLRQLVSLYKGFSDPTRLRILNLLVHRSHLKVKEIANILAIPQSTISRQLAQLRASTLIEDERDGTWVKYNIVDNTFIKDSQMLSTLKMAARECPDLIMDIERLVELVPLEGAAGKRKS